MAAKTKKILITTERRERVVIRSFGGGPKKEFCPMCDAESSFVEIDAAAGPALVDGVASGRFHSRPAEDGRLLVCLRSMAPTNTGT